MFDPIIFENLKVVIEGSVYDLDEAGTILVTNRIDRVDLAAMSRYYAIAFREKEEQAGEAVAEICLHAGLEDLAAEIMDHEERGAGCRIEVGFQTRVQHVNEECGRIAGLLSHIWQNRPQIRQCLSFSYPQAESGYVNRIVLDFGRKITEEQIEDIDMLIDHAVYSLQSLNRLEPIDK